MQIPINRGYQRAPALVLQLHTLIEWFGLERTSKLILFPPPVMGRDIFQYPRSLQVSSLALGTSWDGTVTAFARACPPSHGRIFSLYLPKFPLFHCSLSCHDSSVWRKAALDQQHPCSQCISVQVWGLWAAASLSVAP